MALFRSMSRLSLILASSSLGVSCLMVEAIATPSIAAPLSEHTSSARPPSGTRMELAQINIQLGGDRKPDTDANAGANIEVNIENSDISADVPITSEIPSNDVPDVPSINEVIIDGPETDISTPVEPQTTLSSGPIQITTPQPSIPQPSIDLGPAQVTFPGVPGAPATPTPSVEAPQPNVSTPSFPQPNVSTPSFPQPNIPQPSVSMPSISQPSLNVPNSPSSNTALPETPQPSSYPGAIIYPEEASYPSVNSQQPTILPSSIPQGRSNGVGDFYPNGQGPVDFRRTYPTTAYPRPVQHPVQLPYPHSQSGVIPSNTQIISPQPTVINMGIAQPTQLDSTLPAAINTLPNTPNGSSSNVQLVCSAAGQGTPTYGIPSIYRQSYGAPVYGGGMPVQGQHSYPATAPLQTSQNPGPQDLGAQFISAPTDPSHADSSSGSSNDLSGWAQSVLATANPQVGVEVGSVGVNVPVPVGAIAGSLLDRNSADSVGNSPSRYAIDPNTGYVIDPATGYLIESTTGYLIHPATGNPLQFPVGYPTFSPPTSPIGYPASPEFGALPPITPGATQVFTSHPTVINVVNSQATGAIPGNIASSSLTPTSTGVQLICNPGPAIPAYAPQYFPTSATEVSTPNREAEVEEEDQSSGGGLLGGYRPTFGIDVGPFTIGIPLPF